MISIITATRNAGATLSALVASVEAQTDRDFEWVVVDGASADETLAYVEAADLPRKTVISEPDFGIYDALNKGVRASQGDFYLVVGADDVLAPDAVANYRVALASASSCPDIVTAPVMTATGLVTTRPGMGWLVGMRGVVTCHALGCLIRRSLHDTVGDYSRRFPIAADQYFIKRAVQQGARVCQADFCAGRFGAAGTSSVDTAGALAEFFRVQLATEPCKALQVLLFILRLLKNYQRLR